MVSLQPLIDVLRGRKNDPKAMKEALSKMALESHQQAALERAIVVCSGELGLTGDQFLACLPEQFERELQKPSRIETTFTPTPPPSLQPRD